VAGTLVPGQRTWKLKRDRDGHREYTIVHIVRVPEAAPGSAEGPATVLQTPGLPLPGSTWDFDNDLDVFAYCKPDAEVSILEEREGDPAILYKVEQTFSTRPDKRCQDTQIEDPLLEPPRVRGGFIKYTVEATHDRNGDPILNSAHEVVRGPGVEFDKNRHSISIEQNVASWQDVVDATKLIDCLNDNVLWGFPSRCVKLSNVSWEKRFFGSCSVYFSRVLEFDVSTRTDPDTNDVVSGFDRELLDEGTKVLKGRWSETTGNWVLTKIPNAVGVLVDPDPDNPTHFQRAKDRNDENCRMPLDGHGLPAETVVGTGSVTRLTDIGKILVEYYPNDTDVTGFVVGGFFSLNIPTDIDFG